VPKFNLTLDYKSDKEIKSGIKIAEKTNNKRSPRANKLSLSIEEISDSIEN